MKNTMIVIPSLEPDQKLLALLEIIQKKQNAAPILIIDDGSGVNYRPIFNEAEDKFNCLVVHHSTNKGKGAALKTAMKLVLSNYPQIERIVTIDSDGQHDYEDMVNCVELSMVQPTALILGVRKFEKDVPLRSRFGNILTRKILKWTTAIDLEDTQTGLRVIPREFMPALLEVNGDRFEYETNMLIETKNQHWPIFEQPISTIYIEDNHSSHFRVIRDSIAIYSVFLRYLVSSVASFLVDVVAYALIIFVLSSLSYSNVVIASFLSRLVSSIFNYYVNRKFVFSKGTKNSIYFYFLLVIFQISLSATLVYVAYSLVPIGNSVVWKVIVDSLLFLGSYHIQKKYIFKRNRS